MHNSIGSALSKVDGSANVSAQNANGNNSHTEDTPFNQLLGSAQRAMPGADVAHSDELDGPQDQQLSADVDIFSDSLSDLSFGGKIMPTSGQSVPLSDLESTERMNSLSLAENSDDADALVTWQQSQLDWFRQSTSPGVSQGTTTSWNTTAAGLALANEKFNESEDVASILLSKNDAATHNKSNASLMTTVASELSKPTTGFATAMQLSSATTSLPLVKLAIQSSELKSEFPAGLEFSAAPQTRTSDNIAARAPVNLTVTQNALTDPAWSQAMAAKISWMGGNGVHSATLQLRPAELGSIHIQLSIQGDTTSVQIQTQNKETSELMEKMMPRLHSGMENQGLRLEDVKVSHNPNLNGGDAANSGQQFAGQSAGDRSGAADDGSNGGSQNRIDDSSSESQNATVVLQNSGVDYYA